MSVLPLCWFQNSVDGERTRSAKSDLRDLKYADMNTIALEVAMFEYQFQNEYRNYHKVIKNNGIHMTDVSIFLNKFLEFLLRSNNLIKKINENIIISVSLFQNTSPIIPMPR